MKRIGYSSLAFALVVPVGLIASSLAIAANGRDCLPPVHTPVVNGVVIVPRIWNDFPASNLSFFDGYPGQIWIRDSDPIGLGGYANLHTWSFSEDGGVTPAVFENCSGYRFHATLVLKSSPGTIDGPAEAGLRLSPSWWSDIDGKFMVRADWPSGNGEIACFGGRFPYFNFTVAYGIWYENDQPVDMEIVYNPHSLTAGDPATITFNLTYKGSAYSSGPLPFDEGNPSEDPPSGLWGEQYRSHAGGYFQAPCHDSGRIAGAYDWIATWSDLGYNDSPTPARPPTWGQLKTLYR